MQSLHSSPMNKLSVFSDYGQLLYWGFIVSQNLKLRRFLQTFLHSYLYISWLLFRLLLHVTLCNSFQWRILSVSCDLSTPNQGTELLSLRLAVSGSIVDPWVYILLRKETLSYIHKMMRRCQRNYDVNLQSSTSLDMNSMWLRVYI